MVEMSCWSGSLSLHIPFISPDKKANRILKWVLESYSPTLVLLLTLFFGAQIGLIDLNGSENKRWNYLTISFFSFLLSFQVNKGSNNHVVYCDALRKTRGVSEAALACRYFLPRTRRCSNFTEENETHTRVNREEFNSCKTCDCSSLWEKWTEVNRNRMKYTAVITSVFSYP